MDHRQRWTLDPASADLGGRMIASAMSARADEEAQVFGSEVEERIANGHIPDL